MYAYVFETDIRTCSVHDNSSGNHALIGVCVHASYLSFTCSSLSAAVGVPLLFLFTDSLFLDLLATYLAMDLGAEKLAMFRMFYEKEQSSLLMIIILLFLI